MPVFNLIYSELKQANEKEKNINRGEINNKFQFNNLKLTNLDYYYKSNDEKKSSYLMLI